MTDKLVRAAQQVFLPAWEKTDGNDGYVSFEVDPLLEDPDLNMPHAKRVSEYVRLGCEWATGHRNRMIKVPATPAGLDAIEDLVAAGVTVNVTLIFTSRQYRLAREATWRGAQQRKTLDGFKSVYSIFVSRLDVYTEKAVPELSPGAQGMVGILNAKRIWAENQQFWGDRATPLLQEIVFASTGTKKPSDPPWKYVAAFAGSDIQTNPPATNEAVAKSNCTFTRQVDRLPSAAVVDEIDRLVDMEKLESTLMAEGIAKFANPQKSLLAMVAKKRAAVA
jgi:transaldolase